MKELAKKMVKKINEIDPFDLLNKFGKKSQGMDFILSYLSSKEGMVTAGELAIKLNVSTARIAVLLKKLEKQGFIEKTVSHHDGRVTIVTITEKGEKHVEEEMEKSISLMKKILKKVDISEINEFIRIANKIKESIN